MERPVVAYVVTLVVALAPLAGCLSATPPKTPNQRAVERAAPATEPPPPPDIGRRPLREGPPPLRR